MTPELQINIYFYTLLVIVIVYSLFGNEAIRNNSRIASLFLLLFVFVMFAFRDVDRSFGDTTAYAMRYEQYVAYGAKAMDGTKIKDAGFYWFTLLLSNFNNITLYFGVIALVYLLPVYLAFRNGLKDGLFVALLLFVCSFSFRGYGVNGLRNGMATSVLVYSFFSRRLWVQLPLFVLATSFHGSVLLPIIVFGAARYYRKPKAFLIFYAVCLVLSVSVGSQLGTIIGDWDLMNSADDRLRGYLQQGMNNELDHGVAAAEYFSHTGFRWDFLLYSFVPIGLGYIYIYRLNYQDKLYTVLYCTYVGCNAFWLLAIYVPFNNRFAYLSWFLYSVVVAYPLLKDNDLVDYQQAKIQLMVLLNYAFTFIMFL